MTKVVFGLDRDDEDGKLQEKEQLKKVTGASPDGSWHYVFDTKDLQPGVYPLLVKATDRAGNESPVEIVNITRHAATEAGRRDRSQAGREHHRGHGGQRREAGTNQDNHRGTRPGDDHGPRRGVSLREGSSTAEYTLHAEGTVNNHSVETTKEITLPGPDEPAKVRIVMKW